MFLGFIGTSFFIMVDNYHLAVVQGVSQTIICEHLETSIQGSTKTQTIETCYTYNPQLLFYGQIIIIAVLLITLKYVYNLSVSYIIRYNKRRQEEEERLGEYFKNNKKKNGNISL